MEPLPTPRPIVKQNRTFPKRVVPGGSPRIAPQGQIQAQGVATGPSRGSLPHIAPARTLREGNPGGALKNTITSPPPTKTDSAGGGSTQPSATETSWQRQYRLRKEAMAASGVKAGCRGCGGGV